MNKEEVKIGMRVRVNKKYTGRLNDDTLIGREGVVLVDDGDGTVNFGVQFPGWTDGHDIDVGDVLLIGDASSEGWMVSAEFLTEVSDG